VEPGASSSKKGQSGLHVPQFGVDGRYVGEKQARVGNVSRPLQEVGQCVPLAQVVKRRVATIGARAAQHLDGFPKATLVRQGTSHDQAGLHHHGGRCPLVANPLEIVLDLRKIAQGPITVGYDRELIDRAGQALESVQKPDGLGPPFQPI
jgi:hypothetical protein